MSLSPKDPSPKDLQVFREVVGASRAGCVPEGLRAALRTGGWLAVALWNAARVGEHPTAAGLLDSERRVSRQVYEIETLGLAARISWSGHVGNGEALDSPPSGFRCFSRPAGTLHAVLDENSRCGAKYSKCTGRQARSGRGGFAQGTRGAMQGVRGRVSKCVYINRHESIRSTRQKAGWKEEAARGQLVLGRTGGPTARSTRRVERTSWGGGIATARTAPCGPLPASSGRQDGRVAGEIT